MASNARRPRLAAGAVPEIVRHDGRNEFGRNKRREHVDRIDPLETLIGLEVRRYLAHCQHRRRPETLPHVRGRADLPADLHDRIKGEFDRDPMIPWEDAIAKTVEGGAQ